MTKSPITVRVGATVTHLHDPLLAQKWVAHLMEATAVTKVPECTAYHGRVVGTTREQSSTPAGSVCGYKGSAGPGEIRGQVSPRCCNDLTRTHTLTRRQRQRQSERLSAPTSATLASRLQLPHGSPSAASTVSNLESPYGSQFKEFQSESQGDELSKLDDDIKQRLGVVGTALTLQKALGATHLQQVEQAPMAYGLPTAARTPVRRIRRLRNQALHQIEPTELNTDRADEQGQILSQAPGDTRPKIFTAASSTPGSLQHAATDAHSDAQGQFSVQAPGDKRDDRAHPHDVHGHTTSISGATTGSARTSRRGTTSGSSLASTGDHASDEDLAIISRGGRLSTPSASKAARLASTTARLLRYSEHGPYSAILSEEELAICRGSISRGGRPQ